MPRISTKVEDYPVVDYFDEMYNPEVETVGEYLNRLERMYFQEYSKISKRGIKGWSKFEKTLRSNIKEAIRSKAMDKAGISWKTESWFFKKTKKTKKFKVLRDRKGKFMSKVIPIKEKVIREKPRREVRRG